METLDRILIFLHYHPESSRSEIAEFLAGTLSLSTLKRMLADAVKNDLLVSRGNARATKYSITPKAHLLMTCDVAEYFKKDADEREMQTSFNFDLIEKLLPAVEIFSPRERQNLDACHQKFLKNIEKISPDIYTREMERLGIDLCWKSSQIEGNTYTLLETERLLKEAEEARGKSKEEAQMLLNHKDALRFLLKNLDFLREISVSKIEDIHSILAKNLGISRNIRNGRVGITGTNYRPLDNDFQIRDAMFAMCELVNAKQNVFEKALLVLLLISYIQPFADGNKRTARIVCNGILLANNYCPLSFRPVSSLDYRESLLIFYEQNNLSAFKKIFIDQVIFATGTYF